MKNFTIPVYAGDTRATSDICHAGIVKDVTIRCRGGYLGLTIEGTTAWNRKHREVFRENDQSFFSRLAASAKVSMLLQKANRASWEPASGSW